MDLVQMATCAGRTAGAAVHAFQRNGKEVVMRKKKKIIISSHMMLQRLPAA